MKIATTLFTCGVCLAPEPWTTGKAPTPYRLYYVKGGTAYFRSSTGEFRLKPGYFYLFPSSLPFLVHQEEEDRLNHLYYDFLMTPAVVSTEPICLSLNSHPMFSVFLPIMESTADAFHTYRTRDCLDTAAAVLEAFLSLFCTIMPLSQTIDSSIISSIAYIEAHYNTPITVRDIADSVFLNEDYFIRKFRKATGMTPYSYLLTLRLRIARSILDNGASLSDAAAAVGYQSASALCHAMKKEKY